MIYIKIQFVINRKHITSPLQRQTGQCCLWKNSLFIARTISSVGIATGYGLDDQGGAGVRVPGG
jgi:hypothetical protein